VGVESVAPEPFNPLSPRAPGSILQYAYCVASTTRITVTLPSDQVAELRKLTDNVSGYVAEAVARQIRHQLLGDDLRRHEEEHGHFSDEELAEARAKIFGAAGSGKDADTA
jgi:post-segregation antitoxin (ccd killing protein)